MIPAIGAFPCILYCFTTAVYTSILACTSAAENTRSPLSSILLAVVPPCRVRTVRMICILATLRLTWYSSIFLKNIVRAAGLAIQYCCCPYHQSIPPHNTTNPWTPTLCWCVMLLYTHIYSGCILYYLTPVHTTAAEHYKHAVLSLAYRRSTAAGCGTQLFSKRRRQKEPRTTAFGGAEQTAYAAAEVFKLRKQQQYIRSSTYYCMSYVMILIDCRSKRGAVWYIYVETGVLLLLYCCRAFAWTNQPTRRSSTTSPLDCCSTIYHILVQEY